MRVEAERRRSTSVEEKRPMTNHVAPAAARSAHLPDGLDWQRFSAAYFPGRRRHDLEALTAYGAYRRSHAVGKRTADKRTAEEPARINAEGGGPAGSAALQVWEDERAARRHEVLAKGFRWGAPERFPHERSD